MGTTERLEPEQEAKKMWAPELPAPGREAGTAHPWSSGTLQCLTHVWKGIQHLGVWVHSLMPMSPIVLSDVAAPECPTDHSPHMVGGWECLVQHTHKTHLGGLTLGCWTTFSCIGHDQKAAGVTGKVHPSHGLQWALKQGL